MPPIVNDVVRVVCAWTRVASPDAYSNSLHFKVTSDGWADNQEFMDEIATFLDDTYDLVNDQIASGMTYTNIDGQNVTQDVLMPAVDWPVQTIGGNASDQLPTQVTARPYFPTTRPKTRAAIGLVPFGESSQGSGGLIDATAVAEIELFCDEFLGTIALINGAVVYGAYNPEFARFTPVDSRIVPDRFRTLRRRRVGVGS